MTRIRTSTRYPFELNRYVYTANDPVNLTDPSGLAILAIYGKNNKESKKRGVILGTITRRIMRHLVNRIIDNSLFHLFQMTMGGTIDRDLFEEMLKELFGSGTDPNIGVKEGEHVETDERSNVDTNIDTDVDVDTDTDEEEDDDDNRINIDTVSFQTFVSADPNSMGEKSTILAYMLGKNL